MKIALVVVAVALTLLAGCATQRSREAAADFAQFESLASEPRVRYEAGGQAYARQVAALLPSAIAQVEAGHYSRFAAPVVVHVCATAECFERRVPGASRFTAAVVYDNRLLLAPRLFAGDARRLYPVLVHELSHLHLGQYLGHYAMTIPVWFHEGLASLVAASGGADLVSEQDARRAIMAGDYFLPDATHDSTRRRYADYWHLKIAMLYRQSMMLLAELRARSGEHFRALLEALLRNEPFDESFRSAYGASALTLAQQFFDAIRCDRLECSAAAAP